MLSIPCYFDVGRVNWGFQLAAALSFASTLDFLVSAASMFDNRWTASEGQLSRLGHGVRVMSSEPFQVWV